jgi:hypothetical protein
LDLGDTLESLLAANEQDPGQPQTPDRYVKVLVPLGNFARAALLEGYSATTRYCTLTLF